MPVNPELVEQVSRLTPAERAELFDRFHTNGAATPHPRITRTPGVQGGEACFDGTRIPVWVVEQYRRDGLSDDDILAAYPRLRHGDLAAAWEYVAAHRDEIDDVIRRNEEVFDGPPPG